MRIALLKINTLGLPFNRDGGKTTVITTKPQTQTKQAAKITYIMIHNPASRVESNTTAIETKTIQQNTQQTT
jgi:hypothetical protein